MTILELWRQLALCLKRAGTCVFARTFPHGWSCWWMLRPCSLRLRKGALRLLHHGLSSASFLHLLWQEISRSSTYLFPANTIWQMHLPEVLSHGLIALASNERAGGRLCTFSFERCLYSCHRNLSLPLLWVSLLQPLPIALAFYRAGAGM